MGEEREIKHIKFLVRNNGKNTSNIMSSYNKRKNNETISSEVDKQWDKFTHFGEDIRTLTKLLSILD
jgi:hypothetical protein